ncbi:N-acetylmuramate/N-acetylglucosamine kinase AmgK [Asticcacaulis sp. AND118]|uniref:N-acetylmuramate/N-acetylglucosamine kinase AmgK n=1 Tax=Asticcacaulis sp. AND118 TaxID=2840468 RepID=UPI001CFF7A61|nr:phosphotransferase [Asticcacaulis sp. AND118]UDF03530.1 phosphotransferase [Asticcacaulis sp. AND118]
MTDREDLRVRFLQQAGLTDARRDPLPGDASTRRYERLTRTDGSTLMLMDQPPTGAKPCPPEANAEERQQLGYFAQTRLSAGDLTAFAGAAAYLSDRGFSAPRLYESDLENGLILHEDLGSALFARLIEEGENEAPLYLSAVSVLAKLHDVPPPATVGDWPLLTYDALALKTGADLFLEWLPQYDPSLRFSAQARADWDGLLAPLRTEAEAGASVFIHRDYHAENLLWLGDREGVARVGLIDFQDCLKAHPAWDLHSLLQDARRDVSPQVEALCLDHYFSLRPEQDREAFMRLYTALATLNQARILGVFARLVTRDHKPRYEAFMPRMWQHLGRNLNAPALKGLRDWFISNGLGDRIA